VVILELEDFPPDAPTMQESQDTTVTEDSPPASAPETVSDEPKRKRGKRKVLKRTTKRDEKGYLGNCVESKADFSNEE
jgi:DNA polymerase subunit Cdc27